MNSDFLDMLSALSAAGADYLVVGAFAMSAHGYTSATGYIDIWVRPTAENAERVWRAIAAFGAPTGDLQLTDLHTPDVVFQIGRPPRRINLLTSIAGVSFETAWASRHTVTISGTNVSFLSRELLIANKRATGRPRDLADAEWLEQEP